MNKLLFPNCKRAGHTEPPEIFTFHSQLSSNTTAKRKHAAEGLPKQFSRNDEDITFCSSLPT